jgi:outer membrane protein assembly factor BamE (lipoprotein component of BamABCDE complex)
MKKIIVSLLLASALSACFITQNEAVRTLSYQQASKAIPIGASKDVVRNVLGNPETINTFNGEEMWSYVDQQVDIGQFFNPITGWKSLDSKFFTIRFNRSGRVKSVDQSTLNL